MTITKITLQDLITMSGDSKLLGFKYDGRLLDLSIELGETDENIVLSVRTAVVRTQLPPTDDDDVFRVCRLEFISLNEHLDVQNGHYVPPSTFAKLMEQSRAGLILGYGLRTSSRAGILRVVGYTPLVVCLVASEEDVAIQQR